MRPFVFVLVCVGCVARDGVDAGADAASMDAPAMDVRLPVADVSVDTVQHDVRETDGVASDVPTDVVDPITCNPACETDSDCQGLCPPHPLGYASCCDRATDRCNLATVSPCPYSCPVGCRTDADCYAACPPERGVACCEATTGTCTLRDGVTGSCAYPDGGTSGGGV